MLIHRLLSEWLWGPLWDLTKGYSIQRHIAFYQEASHWTAGDLRRYRDVRITDLIKHAYARVPYYREVMDQQRLSPDHIRGVEDLVKLPTLTRFDLQKRGPDLLAEGVDFARCAGGASSGSTGEPVVFYHDREAESAGRAAVLFGWMQVGWHLGDRHSIVWGNPSTVRTDWSRRSSRLRAWLTRETRVAAHRLLDLEFLDTALETLYQEKPKFLSGYANAVFVLAARARERGFSPLGCRGVFTTAEMIFEHQRQVIEGQLGYVYDHYGCSEINGVAFQCRARDGYHTVDPHVVVEFEDTGMGEARTVLITDLDNYAMPLIRYRCGDLSVSGREAPCSCGLPFGRLERIIGRQIDLVETKAGGYFLVPSFLGGKIFKQIGGIRKHQVVQGKDGTIEVRLVVESRLYPEDEQRIRDYLVSYVGTEQPFRISVVDDIPAGPNGKIKLFVRE